MGAVSNGNPTTGSDRVKAPVACADPKDSGRGQSHSEREYTARRRFGRMEPNLHDRSGRQPGNVATRNSGREETGRSQPPPASQPSGAAQSAKKRRKQPFLPPRDQPGGLGDPLRKGLSGAMVRWYLRFLEQGMEPTEARKKAEERRAKPEETSFGLAPPLKKVRQEPNTACEGRSEEAEAS